MPNENQLLPSECRRQEAQACCVGVNEKLIAVFGQLESEKMVWQMMRPNELTDRHDLTHERETPRQIP